MRQRGRHIRARGEAELRLIIGAACAILAVALIFFSIWAANTGGGGDGMAAQLAGFALLLVAVFALKSDETRV